ncbi:unnamed protein product [Ectocarpus sp. 12 AP-2014]
MSSWVFPCQSLPSHSAYTHYGPDNEKQARRPAPLGKTTARLSLGLSLSRPAASSSTATQEKRHYSGVVDFSHCFFFPTIGTPIHRCGTRRIGPSTHTDHAAHFRVPSQFGNNTRPTQTESTIVHNGRVL